MANRRAMPRETVPRETRLTETLPTRLALLARTVRHVPPRQVAHRVRLRGQRLPYLRPPAERLVQRWATGAGGVRVMLTKLLEGSSPISMVGSLYFWAVARDWRRIFMREAGMRLLPPLLIRVGV